MSQLSNIKKTLLAEKVEEQLFQYILETPYEVGTKIPNEFELAKIFDVGRSTIREAVKLLISKGILEVRRGSGTYVVSTTPAALDPLGLQKLGEDKMSTAIDLVDVRLMIEPAMAEMAARNATEEDIAKLKECCDLVENNILSDKSYIQEDINFHVCVAECSKNRVIEQLIPIIDTTVMMLINVTHKKLKKETIETHRAIVDAIAERDPIGAKTAMMMHITYNRNMIKKMMKNSEEIEKIENFDELVESMQKTKLGEKE